MKKILASLVFSCLTMFAWAQSEVFNIDDTPDFGGCDAIMHDDNGGLSPYSPDANNEILICSGDFVEQVNLFFLGFSLSPGDSLSIYDGFDTTAPPIGTFGGDSLLFETISSTGPCLYVVFSANGDAEVGDFSARILCGTPCEFPIAYMEGNELNAAPADTVKICPGESVEFDASGSDWTDSATPTFYWDFGDGTTDITTASEDSIFHTYAIAGGYRARLRIEDSNDCESLNLPEIIIFVSTPYIFDLTASSTRYCIGNEVLIGTQAYVDTTATIGDETDNGSSVTWIEDNNIVFDNGIYIPDNLGCLVSEIEFTNFETGVTVQSSADFNSIYFNIEHSYVGDITIRIICPNGQTMSIFPEAGGAGTFLGEPIDDTVPNNPGVGYDYSFSPNSTEGTWMEYLATGGGFTIPAGDYEPEGSFDDLIGCPLNGTWTLEICDIVGADDGYLFEFGIQFVSTLYPEILTFTPIVGNGCDSSYWVNSSVFSSIGENCDWAIFNPSSPGNYTFEYEVVNDFGCVFNDEITIEVVDLPNFTLSVDDFCSGVANLDATASPANSEYTYTWSTSSGFISGSGANVNLNGISDTTSVSVVVDWPAFDNCVSEQSDVVNYIPLIQTTAPFDSCKAIFPLTITASPQNNPGAVYSWSKDGVVMSNETEPVLEVSEQATYTLIVSEPTCPNYSQTTIFHIAPPLIITDSIFDICIEELPFDYNPETQNQDVAWSWSYYPYEETEDNVILLNFLLDTTTARSYALVNEGEYQIVIEQMQLGCSNRDTVNIQFQTEYCTLVIPNIMTPNGDGENDTFNVTSIRRYAGSTCQIFNRWGNLVFEDLDYDGAWSAVDMPDGVYYYVIGVKRNSGIEYYSGDLTILR